MDFLKKTLASKEEHQKRLDICKVCDFHLVNTTCLKCGCFTLAKTKIASQKCPLKKW